MSASLTDSGVANPKLCPCTSCGQVIATTADKCPGCGAPNKWVHPKIKQLIEGPGLVAEKMKYSYTKTTVSGATEKDIPFAIKAGMWLAFVAFLAGLWYLRDKGFLFVPVIGAVPAFVIALIGYFVLYWLFAKNKVFTMNFETGEWTSNDEEFWEPVKSQLMQASSINDAD